MCLFKVNYRNTRKMLLTLTIGIYGSTYSTNFTWSIIEYLDPYQPDGKKNEKNTDRMKKNILITKEIFNIH